METMMQKGAECFFNSTNGVCGESEPELPTSDSLHHAAKHGKQNHGHGKEKNGKHGKNHRGPQKLKELEEYHKCMHECKKENQTNTAEGSQNQHQNQTKKHGFGGRHSAAGKGGHGGRHGGSHKGGRGGRHGGGEKSGEMFHTVHQCAESLK